jgi:hypothetical protein
MSNPPVGWQKVWFFLKNDADVLLLVFTGCCPIPQPKWGYDVAQQYIRRIQPLHDVIWQLLQGELTGADLLWTFVSRHIQQLRRWEMTMWMYPWPSCPNHSFPTELDDTEINARICGILVHGANQNPDPNSIPLRGGVVSPWVSLLKLIFI